MFAHSMGPVGPERPQLLCLRNLWDQQGLNARNGVVTVSGPGWHVRGVGDRGWEGEVVGAGLTHV